MSKSSLDIFSLMLGKQTGGGLKASSVTIKSSPSKTKYLQGEALDLTGLSVSAEVGELSGDVTADVTTVPANGTILTNQTKIDVKYGGVTESIPIEVVTISSIEVTTNPTVTNYFIGSQLDLSGIKVTGIFSDSSTSDITNLCTFTPASGTVLDTVGTNEITVSYNDLSDSISVSVYEADSISVTNQPTKTSYKTDEPLDFTGLIVTASNSEAGLSADVTSACTFNPAEGTTLDEEKTYTISVSYGSLSTSFDVVCQNLPVWDERGLNYNSWETIQAYVKAGLFGTVARVGQTKSFVIEGNTYNAEVVAINDGTGSVGTWYPANTVDFICVELYPRKPFNALGENTNAGGFPSSTLKTVLNSTIYAALPTNLKDVIIEKSHSYQAGSYDFSVGVWTSRMVASSDKLWIPTAYEVTGTLPQYAIDEGSSYNKKYTIGTLNKKEPGETSGYYWWLSSPKTDYRTRFYEISSQGQTINTSGRLASESAGVPICFRVG